MSTQDCMQMEGTRQSKCIRCGEGGEVLVCSDRVCRLAVHEKCMNCSAAFDDKGSFFCPYCWYRHTIVKSNEARKRAMSSKRALSTFLDTKTLCGNQQKKKTEIRNGRKPPSSNARSCNENAHRLDCDEVYNQSVHAEKDQQDKFAQGFEQHQVAAEHQWHMRSSVGHGDGDDHLYGREEGTKSVDESFEGFVANQKFDGVKPLVAVKVRDMIQKGHSREVGDLQNKGVAEDQRESESLNHCYLEEETTLHGDFSVLTKGKQVDATITEENLGRRKEEEQMQPQVEETTATLSRGDPASLVHEKANIGSGMIYSCRDARTSLTHMRHAAQSAKNRMESQNVDSQENSSSELDISGDNNAGDWSKEVIISSKSIKPQGPSKQLTNQIFPSKRRKKLLWRADEEEMLKVLRVADELLVELVLGIWHSRMMIEFVALFLLKAEDKAMPFCINTLKTRSVLFCEAPIHVGRGPHDLFFLFSSRVKTSVNAVTPVPLQELYFLFVLIENENSDCIEP